MRVPRVNRAPTRAEVLRQRDRLLASAVFASSKRLQGFLDHVVSEALAGRGNRIKELSVGMTVFERDESFDPRIDAIVRVEASRLRAKLREYYDGPGRHDPVRIDIPKGGYVPTFTRVEQPPEGASPEAPGRSRIRAGLAALVVVLVAAGAGLAIIRQDGIRGASGEAIPSRIAVLPLRDWSEQPADYFSEAMTDALIARLSERPGLRVTSMGSVIAYKESPLRPSEIARQLGVDHVIEGAVLRERDRVRITANLIDGSNDRNIWSRTYERPMLSVLALQESVASDIATQLAGELVTPRTSAVIDPEAYEAYLKGRYWRNRLTVAGFSRGIRYFQQAIEIEPEYAAAYASQAACHCQLGGHGIEIVAPRVGLPEARRLARKSLELDGSLAEPEAVLGIIAFKYDWDPEAALTRLRRALEKNPSLFEAHLWRSQVLEGMGRHQLAVEQAVLASRLNPLSLAANVNLGWQLYQAGRMEEAEAQFDQLVEFDPGFWGGHWGKGHIHRERASYEKALDAFSRAFDLGGGHTLPLADLGYTHALAGNEDQARSILDQLLGMAGETYVSPVHLAMVYAGLGDTDSAFAWLERARQVRARGLAWLSVTREFEVLRTDPRYAALVSSMGPRD